MRLLSSTFQKTRVLVVFALLLSAGTPLVQYACGVTGETSTTSAIAVESTGSDTAPCGTVAESVHDRLCGAFSSPACEGDACSTDTLEKQSVVHTSTSSSEIIWALSAGDLSYNEDTSSGLVASSWSVPDADGNVYEVNRISVRFRTLSFRL